MLECIAIGLHKMLSRCGYRAALYLSFLITVVHGGFFTYALWYFPSDANRVGIYVFVAAAVSIGLWLQSKIARSVGAVFYLISAGAVAWPLAFDRNIAMSIGTVWAVTMGVLSLVAALIFIFSKRLSEELSLEREKRTNFKKYLLNAFIILIVLAALAVTLNDIVNLASK